MLTLLDNIESSGISHKNLNSVYRACIEWEKRRGLYKTPKELVAMAFKRHAAEKREKPTASPKPPKRTPEELREMDRIRTAKYRAKDPEETRRKNREYQQRVRDKRNARRRENYATKRQNNN